MSVKRVCKRCYRLFFYYLLLVFRFFVKFLPRKWTLLCGRFFGVCAYYILKHERLRACSNITAALHVEDYVKVCSMVKQVFKHMGMNLFEWLRMDRLTSENITHIVRCPKEACITELLKQKKGIIMVTGHIGNWEYLAAYFGLRGHSGGVVGRRLYYERYNQLIGKLRSSVGVKTLYRDSSLRGILNVLRNNGLLGVLPDQNTKKVQGFVGTFFRIPAFLPTGITRIAMHTGSPVVPCVCVRKGNTYELKIGEPLYVSQERGKQEIVRDFTQKVHDHIENLIREDPEQWVWFHKRWE